MEDRHPKATAVKLKKLFSQVEKLIGTLSVSLKGHQMSNEAHGCGVQAAGNAGFLSIPS